MYARHFKLAPTKIIIFCLLALNFLSLVAIYSSLHQAGEFSRQEIIYKEIVWMIISWVLLLIFSFINYRIYYDGAYIFYVFNIILLLIVEFFGKTAMGAQRWLNIGGFNFQPSEVSKIAIILLLARIFSNQQNRGFLRSVLFPLTLTVINAFIIFKQPDLGTAVIVILIFFIMGFSSRVKKRYFVVLIALGLAMSPFIFKHLKGYQVKRLSVFINPDADPLGAGYTIIQSKIAIGSGMLLGKGFLAGTQNQFNFLPERHTDFIFTVVGEEGGFVGSVFLLLIYWLIVRIIINRAKITNDHFARFLALGISALFFLHVFINIGMTLGVLPVVGVPLLFLSYGGTHLMVAFILVGIFLNICHRE